MTRLPILIHIIQRELALYDRTTSRVAGEAYHDFLRRKGDALDVLFQEVRKLGAAAVLKPTEAMVDLGGIRAISALGMPQALRHWLALAEGRL